MKNNLESNIQNKLILWEIISQFLFAQDFPVGLKVTVVLFSVSFI